MMEKRRYKIIEKAVNDKWIPFIFQDLRVGDTFRIRQDNGISIPGKNGNTEFKVKTAPVPCEPEGNFILGTEKWQ